MSTRPIDQPLMHPEALWSRKAVTHYATSKGLDAALYLEREDFPRPFRIFERGQFRWLAGEVIDYFSRPPRVDALTRDHILYRHFDAEGNLLYVGVSLSSLSRLRAHSHRSSWFRRVARIDLEHFDTRAQALAAESRAIANESPRHNRV